LEKTKMTRTTTATPTRKLVNQTEAAEFAGVCTRTIRNWIAAGVITGYRTGPRLIRVDIAELEAALLQPMGGTAA
jgi:excisionase family DNA binding protein